MSVFGGKIIFPKKPTVSKQCCMEEVHKSSAEGTLKSRGRGSVKLNKARASQHYMRMQYGVRRASSITRNPPRIQLWCNLLFLLSDGVDGKREEATKSLLFFPHSKVGSPRRAEYCTASFNSNRVMNASHILLKSYIAKLSYIGRPYVVLNPHESYCGGNSDKVSLRKSSFIKLTKYHKIWLLYAIIVCALLGF